MIAWKNDRRATRSKRLQDRRLKECERRESDRIEAKKQRINELKKFRK